MTAPVYIKQNLVTEKGEKEMASLEILSATSAGLTKPHFMDLMSEKKITALFISMKCATLCK